MSLVEKLNSVKTRVNNIENAIDSSGVLDDTDGTVTDKVNLLIEKAQNAGGEIRKPYIDTRLITDWSYFFSYASNWDIAFEIDTSNGTNFSNMYFRCERKVSEFPWIDTSKGTNFSNMYNYCWAIKQCPLTDVGNGTAFNYMLANCDALQSVKLNTHKGVSFNDMLSRCTSLMSAEIYTENATNLTGLFYDDYRLVTIVSPLDFSKVTNLTSTFYGCKALKNIEFVRETIKISISFSNSPDLTAESKQSIFDGLATVTTAQTLTLNANTKILQSQVDAANAKGWTVAGGTIVSEDEYYG